jgi:HK97 family phage prohead protease
MDWECKDCKFELKEADKTKGEFTGFASVYNNTDLGGDIIRAGAFTRTIRANGGEVPLLWSHNMQQPIGAAKIEDHERGLKVRGKIAIDTPTGAWIHKLMHPLGDQFARAPIRGLSFGYETVKHIFEGEARVLQEVKLYEVSPVVFPMNPKATISSVKQDGSSMLGWLVFGKEQFEVLGQAQKWADEHGYKTDAWEETEGAWLIWQRKRDEFEDGSFKTTELENGVESIAGKLKSKSIKIEEQIAFLMESMKDLRQDMNEFKATLVDQGFLEDPDLFHSLRALQEMRLGGGKGDPLFDDGNCPDPVVEHSLVEMLRDVNDFTKEIESNE